MKQFDRIIFSLKPLLLISTLLIICQTGCNSDKTGSSALTTMTQVQEQAPVIQSKINFGSIAVIDISVKHPTARLVYKEENVRDQVTRKLQESKGFKVIDWARMKDVLFRRNLESSDLKTNISLRKEVGDLLLNDYFLEGTVTSYGERMEYSSSAFSKEKTQVVDVELELFIKNSLTNEIIASANGQGVTKHTITQTLGFGAAGGNNTIAANRVLGLAIDKAVNNLLAAMKDVPKPAPALQRDTVAKVLKQPAVKVLFILSETEERNNTTPLKKTVAENFAGSSVEYAMAKVFSDATYQVLTADDVLGRGHGISGGENILLSGWVNEQDIEEFENLLQARSGLASYAMKVGKMAHADIVVSGTVKYELGETSGPGEIQGKTNSVMLTAKAVLVKTKRTYHISIIKENYMAVLNPSNIEAREFALAKAATKAGHDILTHTPLVNK